MIRSGVLIASAVVLTAGAACSDRPTRCVDATLTGSAQASLSMLATRIDFKPVLPCGYGSGFVVRSVVGDTLPGPLPLLRISFVVERDGERSYVFSQTRSPITSFQIPQSTHRLRLSTGAVVAEGFAGPSGSGEEMAYLRWRTGDVTYELDATLGRTLDEAEAKQLATALMQRTVQAASPP